MARDQATSMSRSFVNTLPRDFPSFFVLGAQKAGTTTLHEWLVQQPDVCLPRIKETHFFSHDDLYRYGLRWYRKQFPTPRQMPVVIGEVDPNYMYFAKAPKRIKAVSPTDKKFIFVLRHPVERAYSHYLMSVRRGLENLPFQDALDVEESRIHFAPTDECLSNYSYLSRSRYCDQIARYHHYFPDSSYLYVKFDDLISAQRGYQTYARICEFIGVRTSPTLAKRDEIHNQASVPRSIVLRDFLYGGTGGRFRKAIGRLIPSSNLKRRIALQLDKLNQRPAEPEHDSNQCRISANLLQRLSNEIKDLQTLTQLDCSDWLTRMDRYDAIE